MVAIVQRLEHRVVDFICIFTFYFANNMMSLCL